MYYERNIINVKCLSKLFDDTDVYFEPEEEICIKTLPQADEHGQLQETPAVRMILIYFSAHC